MKKSLLLCGCLSALLFANGISQFIPSSQAADPPAPAPKPTTFPYHGKLHSVDLRNQTVNIAGKKKIRVIKTGAQTRFTKGGRPAKLSDGLPGEEVAGIVFKNAQGAEEAVTVRFGPKPQAAAR